ncbi:MAG TPA: NAD-dependent epimerase/dehydratase family protein [Acidimicrobiales bacterium]
MRVLVTGMGGELGTRITNLLEADPTVDEILGIDLDPPRRRITRAEFHRVDPRDRRKTVRLVRGFEPELVLHLGVFEPSARSEPTAARIGTAASAVAVLGAAAQCPSIRHIVVRSGIEIYGRGRGAPTRPDEAVAPRPTTAFGRSLLQVEDVAAEAGLAADIPVCALRFAPVVGPSVPSPLGRYLRLPVVPVGLFSELPFSLLHQEDAAAAVLAAVAIEADGALNVVGPGAVTGSQAVRMGGRIPLPVTGPGWLAARAVAELLSSPIPDHVRELLVRGRCAEGALAEALLGISPRSTPDVIRQLYDWDTVQLVAVSPRTPS